MAKPEERGRIVEPINALERRQTKGGRESAVFR